MKKAHVFTGTIVIIVATASQACTFGSDTYITSEPGTSSTKEKDGGAKSDGAATLTTGPATGSCGGAAFAAPDLSKLTACGEGRGHCYDKTKTPQANMLAACPDASQVCVPDEVLAAAGNTLKTCTSGVGAGGACITMALIPLMASDERAKGFLKQDVCNAGQICAPCVNPLENNASTGLCEPTGVFGDGAACADSSKPAPTTTPDAGSKALVGCCMTRGVPNGVCLSDSLIPEDRKDEAPVDSCTSGNRCVPKSMVEGTASTCNSGLLGKGVCLDTCFNEMMGFASMVGILGRDRCGATEVCVPCSFAGSDVPGCS